MTQFRDSLRSLSDTSAAYSKFRISIVFRAVFDALFGVGIVAIQGKALRGE
jgi:hypothetical protein